MTIYRIILSANAVLIGFTGDVVLKLLDEPVKDRLQTREISLLVLGMLYGMMVLITIWI